jgi:hypothetical protein
LDTVSRNFDSAITAHSEWHTDIDQSLLAACSELESKVKTVDDRLQHTTNKLEEMQDTFSNKLTKLESLSISDSQVLSLLNDTTFDHIHNLTLSPAIDEVISWVITERITPLSKDIDSLKTTSSPISSKHKRGFTQVESKDFCASKFTKELECIKLQGDKLRDLELFWDSIQRALTNVCQVNQVFPYFQDLEATFTFHLHLLGDPRNP